MKKVCRVLTGIRLINQDPWECLISFIFSSNNNIKRITKGLGALRARYGNHVCSLRFGKSNLIKNETDANCWSVTGAGADGGVGGSGGGGGGGDSVSDNDEIINLYTFPSIEVLSTLSEDVFRAMG
jgi:hypothetical protein